MDPKEVATVSMIRRVEGLILAESLTRRDISESMCPWTAKWAFNRSDPVMTFSIHRIVRPQGRLALICKSRFQTTLNLSR